VRRACAGVAVSCSESLCVAACCSVLHCVALCCSMLQCVCECVSMPSNVRLEGCEESRKHAATNCNTRNSLQQANWRVRLEACEESQQHTTTDCNTLQLTATGEYECLHKKMWKVIRAYLGSFPSFFIQSP